MLIFAPKGYEGKGSDLEFWGEDYVMRDEPLGLLDAIAEAAAVLSNIYPQENKTMKIRFKKRGNIKGLGKHLAHKYGPQDEGFFTRCMAASELQDYDEETRKAICARAHKEQIGKWPGEGRKKKKECTSCRKRIRIVRRLR